MDKTNSGIFGFMNSSSGSYGGSDSTPLDVPVSSNARTATLSPYLDFDPSIINQDGPQFIFPEGATRSQRGRFELAFSQIGVSIMTGAFLGGMNGLYTGLKETASLQGSVKRTQMLNIITKRGAATANALGVVAVMYSGFGVIMSLVRQTDDDFNTLGAATLTGMLYKSSAGLRKCGIGGLVGLGIASTVVLWSNKDRLHDRISANVA